MSRCINCKEPVAEETVMCAKCVNGFGGIEAALKAISPKECKAQTKERCDNCVTSLCDCGGGDQCKSCECMGCVKP